MQLLARSPKGWMAVISQRFRAAKKGTIVTLKCPGNAMRPLSVTDDAFSPRAALELLGMVVIGSLHVATEIWLSPLIARVYNGFACLLVLGYLGWRVRSTGSIIRKWGLRGDNFFCALGAQMLFVIPGAIALLAYGHLTGGIRIPSTFWLTLALYPAWALAQQFALQNLIAANLAPATPRPWLVATAAGALFAASHYPCTELVLLTFIAGVPFTLIYRRFPNLWAVAIAHATLGSLAVYLVLREDPGAMMVNFLFR